MASTSQAQPAEVRRMTIKEPTWTQSSTSEQLQEALYFRIKNDFNKAQGLLETILAAE